MGGTSGAGLSEEATFSLKTQKMSRSQLRKSWTKSAPPRGGAVCAKVLGHERARPIRGRESSPGDQGECSMECSHAFVEGNIDFILSLIANYLRVSSREVT